MNLPAFRKYEGEVHLFQFSREEKFQRETKSYELYSADENVRPNYVSMYTR